MTEREFTATTTGRHVRVITTYGPTGHWTRALVEHRVNGREHA